MRREDREAMRGKTQEGQRPGSEKQAEPDRERIKREQMRGGTTGESVQPRRQPGRLPIPD